MIMTELVSIIVPVFNVEQYLPRCVDSLIRQSYSNIEIILVDDGSTDMSSSICDEYKEIDNRIIVIHKENGGLSDARNKGIEIAKGQYYMFVDSDDYISVSAVENMYSAIKKYDAQISACNMIRFFDDKSSEPFYKPCEGEKALTRAERFDTLYQPSACNKMFLRQLFEDVRFPKGKYYEDTYVYHELVFQAKTVVLTGTDDYWYYLRKSSILGTNKYNIKYFDFIEAVYIRAMFLLRNQIDNYDREAFLSLYAAYSNATKCIKKTEENKTKFDESIRLYSKAYNDFSKKYQFGAKQRIRLFLLRYTPRLHAFLY